MEKRLFFGFSIKAPWPTTYPQGRIIEESSRHLTLAFLGQKKVPPLEQFPLPPFDFGPIGQSDKLLFLPEFKPRVVAEHIHWFTQSETILLYHNQILDWLGGLGELVDRRPLLSHVSLARAPFMEKEWEAAFEPLPMLITGVHLYESVGNLRYSSLFHIALPPPFEEFHHTADIAFYIHGSTFEELYLHAALALAFEYPPLLNFSQPSSAHSIQDVTRQLNQMIATCDAEIGAPFKAVSHHGKLLAQTPFKWEMIVDV